MDPHVVAQVCFVLSALAGIGLLFVVLREP
jgi:hypothetical protein